jgi:hypothetical protein
MPGAIAEKSRTIIAALTLAIALTILTGAAAGVGRVKTYIYLDSRPVGYVLFRPDSREWQLGVDSCDFNIAYAEHGGPQQLEGKEGIGSVSDLLTRVSEMRWNYRTVPPGGGPIRTGHAVRVGSDKWDVYGPRRRIGFVRGRDGPAAALALLASWPRLLRCLR